MIHTSVNATSNPADSWPNPATASPSFPAPTGSSTLASQFDGISPNGTWSLYAIDDACDQDNTSVGNWSLDFTLNAAALRPPR